MIKKEDEVVGIPTIINRAVLEVPEFEALLLRFKRSISVLGRSELIFKSYARNIAAMTLHFGKVPTELDVEQVQEYFFYYRSVPKHPRKPILNTPFTDFDFS